MNDWVGKYCERCSKIGFNLCKCKSRRGGLQTPAGGRPPLPPAEKRQTHSLVLAPGSKEIIDKLAFELDDPSWGYLIDRLARLYQNMPEITINFFKKGKDR